MPVLITITRIFGALTMTLSLSKTMPSKAILYYVHTDCHEHNDSLCCHDDYT